jgi:hypothetical protein
MDTVTKSLTVDNNYLSIEEFAESGEEYFVEKALAEEYKIIPSATNSKRGADKKPRFTLQRFLSE